jgi:hypothetical protein
MLAFAFEDAESSCSSYRWVRIASVWLGPLLANSFLVVALALIESSYAEPALIGRGVDVVA